MNTIRAVLGSNFPSVMIADGGARCPQRPHGQARPASGIAAAARLVKAGEAGDDIGAPKMNKVENETYNFCKCN